jgi:hypothetical protein
MLCPQEWSALCEQFKSGRFRDVLAGFLREVEQGAEIVVMAEPPGCSARTPAPPGPGPLGLMRGKIRIVPDFDETPAELIAAMDGNAAPE